MQITNTFIIAVVVAAVIGSIVTLGVTNFQKPKEKTQNELIKEFYLVENAVHVSPHSIRGQMDKGGGTYVLVDLRSQEEYEREHIIGAVNIPAYSDPDASAYQEVDRIIGQFKDVIANNPGKDVIVYCYSVPCMTGRKIGKMLAEHDIYVKHLGIGWNEWRFFWNLWNHEHELGQRKVEDYIWEGKDPGVPTARELPSPCGEGEFSC